MNILIFDIEGKFAHFRKFYTNSSSASYPVPSRTVISGIIAAILGLERDSYYNMMNSNNSKIAMKCNTKTRSIVQSLNYVRAENVKEIVKFPKHTQIPFEMICAEDINDKLSYRVYYSHDDFVVMDNLQKRIKNGRYYYSPYLGSASFACNVNYIDLVKSKKRTKGEDLKIATVVRKEYIESLSDELFDLKLLIEKMPVEFKENREVCEAKDYIFEKTGKKIKLKTNQNVETVEYKFNGSKIQENILFM